MIKFAVEFTRDQADKYLLNIPPYFLPKSILVMTQRDKSPIPMPLQDVEKLFKFTYRPFLTFSTYKDFLWTLRQCPLLLRFSSMATENHELFAQYHHEIDDAIIPPISIRWINPSKEYGVVAEEKIASGSFVGEYTGLVRRLSRIRKNTNSYCFCYPTLFWSMQPCAIDGQKYGNVMRFLNHDDNPNLEPHCLVDRGLLHMVFFAKRDISAGEELTFDYGPDFWRHRQKKITSTLHP